MSTNPLLRAAALLLGLQSAGCFSESPDGTGPDGSGEIGATVQMTQSLSFSPGRVEIRSGQAVRWMNPSPFVHTATANPSLARDPSNVRLPAGASTFNSGDVGAAQDYVHTFSVPGEYRYFCIPHEQAGMVGTVVVRE